MSLLVWLPLNGNLDNQGTASINPVNGGASVTTSGKLGSCYQFSGTQYIDTGFKENFGTGDFTLAAWVYLTSNSAKSYQPIISNKAVSGTSLGVAIFFNHNQNKFLWSTGNGSKAAEYWTSETFPNIYNKWTHVVMIRKGTSGYFYIDGERKDLTTSTPTIFDVSNSTYNMVIGALGSPSGNDNYKWTGKIQDVRVYDHAISQKKAKLLAQGLILHYPLSQEAAFPFDTTNPTINSPYEFRQAGGGSLGDDINSKFETIVGGSVAWNQLVENGNFSQGTTGWTTNVGSNGEMVVNDGKVTMRCLSVNTNRSWPIYRSVDIQASHKYYIYCNIKRDLVGVSSGDSNLGYQMFLEETDGNTSIGFGYSMNLDLNDTGVISKIILPEKNYDRVGVRKYTCKPSETGDIFTAWNLQVFDLTQMFGATIADYVYSLEETTSGSGISWLQKYGFFTEDYYEYNPGEIKSVTGLVSHGIAGFNQWDEQWELGDIDGSIGSKKTGTYIISKNHIPVQSSTTYCISSKNEQGNSSRRYVVYYYDGDQKYLRYISLTDMESTFTTDSNCKYILFRNNKSLSTQSYNNDICLNFSDPSRNGEYEPYHPHFYPLDSSLTLRGIPKLDSNNNLYYDGDTYDSDGKVTRKYGVVDLGTLNWTYTGTDIPHPYFYSIIPNLNTDGLHRHNIFCTKYDTVYNTTTFNNSNKVIFSYYFRANGVNVRDDAYTNAADFKAAMNGVPLVYELATPTIDQAPVPVYNNENGSLVTINDGADDAELKEAIIEIKPIQGGTGDPAPDNIIPISGRNSVIITRTGKNLFDKDAVTVGKWLNVNTGVVEDCSPVYALSDWISVKAGITYVWMNPKSSRMWMYGMDKTPISKIPDVVYTPIVDGYIRITIYTTQQPVDTFMVVVGDTLPDYEPYAGDTYDITLPTSAGTVYGGTLDVGAGTLTVTHEKIVMGEGNNLFSGSFGAAAQGKAIYAQKIGNKQQFINSVCSHFKYSALGFASMPLYTFGGSSGVNNTITFIFPSDYTKDTANAWLADQIAAGTPVEIIRKLSEPQTYTLDPTTIRTLLGYNAFFADSGDIAITYETNSPTYDATPALPFCNPQPITKFSTESFSVDSGDGINLLPGTSTIYTSRKIPGKIGQTIEDVIETNKKVYDVSGMRNNAVQEGIVVSSDTPLYKGSYDFNGDASSNPYVGPITIPYSCLTGNWTIAWWAKSSNFTSTMPWAFNGGNHLNIYYVSNILTLNTGDGTSNPFVDSNNTNISTASLIGNWHHYVVSSNGTTNDLYIDGEYVGHSKTYRNPTSNVLYLSGYGYSFVSGNKWLGNLSDFRIYTTPLSGDAIKDLYYQSKESITTYLTTEGNATLTNENNAALFTMESEGDSE